MVSGKLSTRSCAAVSDPLLSVDGLRVEFATERGTIYAVNDISFSIGKGETLGIVGESGCGKSVTALALMGILARAGRVTAGTALFAGRDLLKMSDRELRGVRGKEIGMIFQDPMTSLNPVHTIGGQIREALTTHFDMSTARSERQGRRASRPGGDTRARDRESGTIHINSPAECASA